MSVAAHPPQNNNNQGHVSRHSLGLMARAVCAVPFPAAGPEDAEGRTVHHNILCVAGWNEDVREQQLNLINLNVHKVMGEIADPPEVSLLSSFSVPSRSVTCMDVSQETRGSAVVVAGGDDGGLYRLKLTLPTTPGSSPSAVRLDAADIGETDLLEFCRPHGHLVTDVRVHESGEVAASVSMDGSLCLTDLRRGRGAAGAGGGASQTVVRNVATSFTQCAFTRSSNLSVVTGSHQGCCVVWDARNGGNNNGGKLRVGNGIDRNARSKNAASGGGGEGEGKGEREPVTALATHPSKPHVFVCGRAGGLFQEFDFRYPDRPTFSERVGRDAITSMCYENQGSSVERLRFCTEGGCIYKVVKGDGAVLAYEEASTPFTGLAVSSRAGDSQVFCTTGSEGLVYLSMSSKYY